MKTSEAFPSNYLRAADIGERTITLEIEDYRMEELNSPDNRKQTKPVLYFKRARKGLVLNVTNSRTIEAGYGDEMDAWIGKPLQLYTRIVEARGEEVQAIRVRVPQLGGSTAPSHQQQRPAPEPVEPFTERNPPPQGQPFRSGLRDELDDDIPF